MYIAAVPLLCRCVSRWFKHETLKCWKIRVYNTSYMCNVGMAAYVCYRSSMDRGMWEFRSWMPPLKLRTSLLYCMCVRDVGSGSLKIPKHFEFYSQKILNFYLAHFPPPYVPSNSTLLKHAIFALTNLIIFLKMCVNIMFNNAFSLSFRFPELPYHWRLSKKSISEINSTVFINLFDVVGFWAGT
jgi:hypothetical protein